MHACWLLPPAFDTCDQLTHALVAECLQFYFIEELWDVSSFLPNDTILLCHDLPISPQKFSLILCVTWFLLLQAGSNMWEKHEFNCH